MQHEFGAVEASQARPAVRAQFVALAAPLRGYKPDGALNEDSHGGALEDADEEGNVGRGGIRTWRTPWVELVPRGAHEPSIATKGAG